MYPRIPISELFAKLFFFCVCLFRDNITLHILGIRFYIVKIHFMIVNPDFFSIVFLENRGLNNDNVQETFDLKHEIDGNYFPCRYIKIGMYKTPVT